MLKKIFLILCLFCLNFNEVFARSQSDDEEQYSLICGDYSCHFDLETYQKYLNQGYSYADIRTYFQKYTDYKKEWGFDDKYDFLNFYDNFGKNFGVYLKYIRKVENLNKKFNESLKKLSQLGYENRYDANKKISAVIDKAENAIQEFENLICSSSLTDEQIAGLDAKLSEILKIVSEIDKSISNEKAAREKAKKEKEAELARQAEINRKWAEEHPEEAKRLAEKERILETMGGRICSNFATIMNVIVGHRRNGTPINIAYKMIESTYSHGAEAYTFMKESVKLAYENPDRMEQILNDNSWLTLCAETLNGF